MNLKVMIVTDLDHGVTIRKNSRRGSDGLLSKPTGRGERVADDRGDFFWHASARSKLPFRSALIRTRPKKAAIDPFYSFARKGDQVTNDRPSIVKRVLRTLSRFFMAVFIGVGATLGWQSYGDALREMIAMRAPMLTWFLSVPTTKSPVVIATNPMQQLEALASTLNVMRRSVERLVADQEQMAQNVDVLQAVEEDIRKKMSFMPPAQQAASLIQEQLSQAGALASAPRRSLPLDESRSRADRYF
jgi:hypothetical protein